MNCVAATLGHRTVLAIHKAMGYVATSLLIMFVYTQMIIYTGSWWM